MIRTLLLALTASLFASSSAVTSSLAWPYSVVFANMTASVDECAQISGFDFRGGATPSASQLSKMCAAESCGALTSRLMWLNYIQSPTNQPDPAASDATTAFSVPMLSFCWYNRLPTDPCLSDPFAQFARDFGEPSAACRQETGLDAPVNISDAQLEQFKRSGKTLPLSCFHLLLRLLWMVDNMPCPATQQQRVQLIEHTAFVYTTVLGMTQYDYPDHYSYEYDQGWPVPILQ